MKKEVKVKWKIFLDYVKSGVLSRSWIIPYSRKYVLEFYQSITGLLPLEVHTKSEYRMNLGNNPPN